ncbi:MAG: Kelch repeat-containing protein [Blastocatellia bacterium]
MRRLLAVAVCVFALGLGTVASAQTWSELFPTGTPPAGRTYVASGNTYDEVNDRLIIFSGDDGSSVHPHAADVWVLINATGQAGVPAWVQLAPVGTGPIGRILHSTVYDPVSNRLIVHSGCVEHCGQILSDVWVLTNANGIGGPPAWIELPSAPLIRNGHTAVYDPGSNRMVIFGGGTPFDTNEVWVLTDANGIGSPVWQQLAPSGAPPPPRGAIASAVYDPFTNRLIVVGGRSGAGGGTAFNDVWILSNANGLGGTPVWTQLAPSGLPPAPRGGHSLVYDRNANRVIIFGGGTGDLNTYFNDVWVLTNANGTGGVPAWIQLTPISGSPLPRYIFVAGYSAQSNRMAVTMGASLQPDSPLLNDVWVLGLNQATVTICHKPGTPAQQTLVIPQQALAGHLGHGDTVGPCQ